MVFLFVLPHSICLKKLTDIYMSLINLRNINTTIYILFSTAWLQNMILFNGSIVWKCSYWSTTRANANFVEIKKFELTRRIKFPFSILGSGCCLLQYRLYVKNRHALRLTSAGVIKHARSESDALSRRIIQDIGKYIYHPKTRDLTDDVFTNLRVSI